MPTSGRSGGGGSSGGVTTSIKTINGKSLAGSGDAGLVAADVGAANAIVTQVTASRPLVATGPTTDVGASLANSTANNYALSLVAGLGTFSLVQGGAGTLTVTAGTAQLSGSTVTSASQPILTVTEVSPGVYVGAARAIQPLAVVQATGALDAASQNAVLYAVGGIFSGTVVLAYVGDSRVASATQDGPPNNVVLTNRNWLVQAFALAGKPGRILYIGGVSGQRTDQCATRVVTAINTPGVTELWLKMGVNNISGAPYTNARTGTSITLSTSGLDAAADVQYYITLARQYGVKVFVEEDEGTDGGWPASTWTGAMSTQLGIFNAAMEKFCRGLPGVTFIRFPKIYDRTTTTNKHVIGQKYDSTHDADGGALSRAQDVLARYPNLWPPARTNVVNPAQHIYSGDTANPIQLLDNPGFTTRTGGTLNAGGASAAAWTSGQTVGANTTRVNALGLYYTVAGGVCGATAPTHTSGSASDGGVTWIYLCSFGSWATGQVVAAKSFRVNGGIIYYTPTAGIAGPNAPTHTYGTASDGGLSGIISSLASNNVGAGYTDGTYSLTVTGGGGTGAAATATVSGGAVVPGSVKLTNAGSGYTSVPTFALPGGAGAGTTTATFTPVVSNSTGINWLQVCSATNSIPQYWKTSMSNNGAYFVGTNVTAENSIELVVIAFFTQGGATPSTIGVSTGSDMNAAFTARQVLGGTYALQATTRIEDHVNIGNDHLQWYRGDMSNPPTDGWSSSAYWTDNQGRYCGNLPTYPVTKTRQTIPFVPDAQSTTNGNVLGTLATWNNFKLQVQGAGVGFAIVRYSDARMYRVT